MSNVVPYSRPRGALHDLAHLADLGTDRNRLLCVSDRVLYLIHNFANIDVTMRARYAEEFLESGYIPVSEGSEHFSLFMSSYEAFQLEVLDMSCDIVASLAEIRDAIQALAVNAGASGTVCCNYTFDPSSYYEDAPGSGAPSEKCLLSYAFALAWERGANEFYHQYAVGGFPSVGILAAILDEFDLPGQALLEMVSVGVANALPILESVWQGIISSLVLPVTCAIYDAPDAATAKADIYALIDNEQGATGIAADLMKGPIQNNGLNQVFLKRKMCLCRLHGRNGPAFQIKRVVAEIDLTGPLDRTGDDARTQKCAAFTQAFKHASIQIRFCVEDTLLAVGEGKQQLIIFQWLDGSNIRVHVIS